MPVVNITVHVAGYCAERASLTVRLQADGHPPRLNPLQQLRNLLRRGVPFIELALQRVVALLQDDQIMRPSKFSHQWCEFLIARVGFIETAHPPEVCRRKTAQSRKLRLTIAGELLNDGAPPAGALLALDNQPTNIPLRGDELSVHGTQRLILSRTDALFQLTQQRRVVHRFDGAHAILDSNVASMSLADMPVRYIVA